MKRYFEDYKSQINNKLAEIGQPTKGEDIALMWLVCRIRKEMFYQALCSEHRCNSHSLKSVATWTILPWSLVILGRQIWGM